MPAPAGLDTGFFVLHASGHPEARKLWDQAVAGERNAVVSSLTLFEILRLGLRGALPTKYAETAVASIPNVCEVVWLEGADLLRRAARLSHSVGLSTSDALILASLLERGCKEIYTVDSDLLKYKAPGVRVFGLSRK